MGLSGIKFLHRSTLRGIHDLKLMAVLLLASQPSDKKVLTFEKVLKKKDLTLGKGFDFPSKISSSLILDTLEVGIFTQIFQIHSRPG